MRSSLRAVLTMGALIGATTACAGPAPKAVLGAYRLDDGRILSIRPSVDGTLRYREYASGKTGRLYPVTPLQYESGAGFSARTPVALTVEFRPGGSGGVRAMDWTPVDGPPRSGRKIGRERWVRVERNGVRLSGRLHLPDGTGPHPGVVLVHGSGEDPGSDWLFNGDFLVSHGFAVLTYDKRGTGESGGDFTFDFEVLAADAAAVVEFLATQPEVDASRIGLSGYSQGGWVAPLAAARTPVQFVLVSYGMIESPAEEARLEMRRLLTDAGVEGADLAAADSVIRAAVAVVASGLDGGWDEFRTLARRHVDAPWRAHLRGTPVDRLMRYPKWLVRLIGRRELPPGLRWDYDSTELLDTLCVPMTWFLGTEDTSAPNQLTIARLRAWEDEGMPYELQLFEGAEHSMLLFDEDEGARTYTRYAPGYFRAEVEAATRWSRSQAVPSYGPCPGGAP